MVTHRRTRGASTNGTLDVWANGNLVGQWELVSGEHRFTYTEAWVNSPAGRPLSLSLPFTPGNIPHRGDVVRNYFDNLLPDNTQFRFK